MKLSTTLFCLLLALGTGQATADDSWTWIGPEFAVIEYIAVDVADAIYIGGTYMGVTVSHDGGETWVDTGGPNDPSVIACSPTGTVFTNDMWAPFIMRSDDQGGTWDWISEGLPEDVCTAIAVHPLNHHVFAAYDYNGGIFRSTDDGLTWAPTASSPSSFEFLDLEIGGNGQLYSLGDDGLYRSEDNGDTWIYLNSPELFFGDGFISFAPTFALFLGGLNEDTYLGELYRSWDNGETWDQLSNGLDCEYAIYSSITYGPGGGPTLLGDMNCGAYRSENSGDLWTEINDGLTSLNVMGLATDSNYIHYAATSGDGVFKNTADSTVPVEEGPPPASLTLAQNYPNPFNPKTTISFALSEPGFATLKVFDLQGRERMTVFAGERLAGYQSVEFDATGMASGSYFYQLESGGEKIARRFVLLK